MHGGLPAETSGFFGRAEEVAAIEDALSRSRLVTLTGPGGVGKTRLAIRVASQLAQAFPDGVFLANLSASVGAAGVADAVASALGLPGHDEGRGVESQPSTDQEQAADQQPRPEAGWIAGQVRGSRLLLILDTAEHVVDACAALADTILRAGDGPVLMVTSRQPLDLPGEVVFRIPPLAVSDDGGEAVNLFADRAAAAGPGFEVTAGTLPGLVRLCRLLDGIPLAIELAALRLRAVGLDELLVRLPGHLRLLASGRRAAAGDRQQSLHASISWSYALCTPAERLLWTRLSVFADGFDLAAAEAVCGSGNRDGDTGGDDDTDAGAGSGRDLGGPEVLDTLIGLVDKSIVLRAADAGGAARYRLPALVREHGAEQAARHPASAAAYVARHRAHYLGVARAFTASFAGPGQPGLTAALGGDEANLRLALDGALAAGDAAMARDLATALTLLDAERKAAEPRAAYAAEAGYAGGHATGPAPGSQAATGDILPAPPQAGPGSTEQAPRLPRPAAQRSLRETLSAGLPGPFAGAADAAAGAGAGSVDAPDAVQAGRWQLLTAREREVAVLVATGLTNRDIAARLFVSKRTIDAHLEHILSKLGYSSRVQVAALASQQQSRRPQTSGPQTSGPQASGPQASGPQASDSAASARQLSEQQAGGREAVGQREREPHGGERQEHPLGPDGPVPAPRPSRESAARLP